MTVQWARCCRNKSFASYAAGDQPHRGTITVVFCIPEESANAAAGADPEHAAAVRRKDARRSFLGLEVRLSGLPEERAEALVRETWATQAPKRLVNQHAGSVPR
jgi:hypothetical protein